MKFAPALVWCGIAAAALILRLVSLDVRPMHNDEALNALKFGTLLERGEFRYDPHEYHGPTLYYATLPFAGLVGAESLKEAREETLRWVTVFFGVAVVLLPLLMMDGLGRVGAAAAAGLTAISPAMVFYSRYYIHEMLLVAFTLLFAAALRRWWVTRRLGWALAAGIALGLMHATKETFVLCLAALGGAVVIEWALNRFRREPLRDFLNRFRPGHLVAAATVAAVVSVVFFTSFFTNVSGPLDSIRTYLPWLSRAAGETPHVHPWNFYLERLFWFQRGGPVRTEGAILLLGGVGFVAALRGRGSLARKCHYASGSTGDSPVPRGDSPRGTEGASIQGVDVGRNTRPAIPSGESPDGTGESPVPPNDYEIRGLGGSAVLVRLIGFYTLLLGAMYSVIPYKTPWCLLGFLNGLILLAGAGVAVLWQWRRGWVARVVMCVLLAAAVLHLGWQATGLSLKYSTDRANPHVYAHTSPDLLELVERVQVLGTVSPQGDEMLIKVMVSEGDYWPLPWYLRAFNRTGWWAEIPNEPEASVVITNPALAAGLPESFRRAHFMAGNFSLRPQVFLELHVSTNLWSEFMETRRGAL